MGFTNVVWESRSTDQLARDLTDGPGPASMGEAGAAWVRVANEFAAVSADYDMIVQRLKSNWQSEGFAAAVGRLDALGNWLRDMSLAAATNGQRAEEAAVADTEAVLAMPTVSEAVQAKDAQDMMASLAAYNGAILQGNFAEFDETARAQQADSAAVMRQYEDAVTPLAQPWEQPLPADAVQPAASTSPPAAKAGAGATGARSAAAAGVGAAPMPLAAWTAPQVGSGANPKPLQHSTVRDSQAGVGGVGGAGGYAPMTGYGRNGDTREYESARPAETLQGGGEPGASLSDSGHPWQPAAQQAEFTVSAVSWGPSSAVFDDLVSPVEPEPDGFAEEPPPTFEQVSDRWVSPPVIGAGGQAHQ